MFVDPPTGADDTPLDLLTTGGCPAPATNVVGRIYGKGFPAIGQIVVGNTDAGVSQGGSFSVVPADTLRGFAALQRTPAVLAGTYRIVLSCQEALGDRSLGDYVATLVFSSPRSYTARNPASKPVPAAAVTAGEPGVSGAPATGPAPGLGGPGVGPTPEPGSVASAVPGTDRGPDPAGSAGLDDGGSFAPLLAAGLGGFVLAAVLLGVGRLTRRRARVGPAIRSAVT